MHASFTVYPATSDVHSNFHFRVHNACGCYIIICPIRSVERNNSWSGPHGRET